MSTRRSTTASPTSRAPTPLAEISVETNNYSADTGNVGGAVVASVIKSGTNQYRGNVFEFYRNSDFDANTWENNRSGAPKQERRQDIYGFTLGGPIGPRPGVLLRRLPGLAAGRARASARPRWRPRRGAAATCRASRAVIRDPLTGQPFPGNQIPAARISPVARALLDDTANYPLPNRTVPGGVTGNFVGETLLKIRGHQGDAPRRLERLGQRQVLRALLVRHLRRRARRQSVRRWCSRRATTSRSGTSAATGTASSARPWSTSCWSASATPRVLSETYDWSGLGDGNATLRHRRRPADRRAERARLRAAA